MKSKMLPLEFFNRSSVLVARDLIGQNLVRVVDGVAHEFMITETEAYEGPQDKASHAHRGQTARNTPMFGPAGTIYVYFIYGMHWMLNIVCGSEGHPAAVLIRAVEGITGPARITKRLGIDRKLNGTMLGKASGLWIAGHDTNSRMKTNPPERLASFSRAGDTNKKLKILKTPRIGIDSAGPLWSKKLYRFVLKQEKKKP